MNLPDLSNNPGADSAVFPNFSRAGYERVLNDLSDSLLLNVSVPLTGDAGECFTS